MYATPSGPQSIGGVIDDAIRLYSNSFSRCWLLAFLPAAAFGAWQVAAVHYVPNYGVPHFPMAPKVAAAQPLPPMLLLFVLILSLLAAGFQGGLAARQAAMARGDEESFTLGRALATGFLRLPALILSLLLLYLIMTVAVLIVTFAVALPIGIVLNRMHVPMRPVAPAGFAVLILIALLSFMGRLQLFGVAIFVDRIGPLAALKASWRLTQGHWWRATAIMMTAFVMLLVLFLGVAVLENIFGYLSHYGAIHRLVVAPLLGVVAYTALYPLLTAIWVVMYNDFKLRHEGGDLAARVGALDSA